MIKTKCYGGPLDGTIHTSDRVCSNLILCLTDYNTMLVHELQYTLIGNVYYFVNDTPAALIWKEQKERGYYD